MTHILDHIAESLRGEFRPASPDDYFALRLAARLGEPAAAAHYTVLASQYPQETLLSALRRATSCPKPGMVLGKLFHEFLTEKNGSDSITRPRLMALRVERRVVATAVFTGTHLEGRRILQLSSNPDKAASSVASFIRSVLSESDCRCAAIEQAPNRADILRSVLHRAAVAQIRTTNLSLWEISQQALYSAFSHPPVETRQQLRDVAFGIWRLSELKQGQTCALDALALGLFVQTERMFNDV